MIIFYVVWLSKCNICLFCKSNTSHSAIYIYVYIFRNYWVSVSFLVIKKSQLVLKKIKWRGLVELLSFKHYSINFPKKIKVWLHLKNGKKKLANHIVDKRLGIWSC